MAVKKDASRRKLSVGDTVKKLDGDGGNEEGGEGERFPVPVRLWNRKNCCRHLALERKLLELRL